ncbi:ROK family protein [Nocardiaceae bacterium YC2-7]|uniref:ROK family protein n=1 Tax=Antrihabitans stalactiti TaxID=2584121 RepID=A0A848KGA6_9NOCA|nr:ROK family protein [Antrihabitans stalactiti]
MPATVCRPRTRPRQSAQSAPLSHSRTVTDNELVLGIDVGGSTIKGEISDGWGKVVAASSVSTPRGDAAVTAIAEFGAALLDTLAAEPRARVGRAAVLLPGIVDTEHGIAVFSANIGWRDVPVAGVFTERWGMPVLVDHDVTVAGWAEWRFGAGRGYDDVCIVVLGTGIAGALAVGGRLVTGGLGQAGEFGHVVVRPNGIACPCGNVGCVETVASAAAIAREYARRSGRSVAGAADVVALLATDAVAQQVWSEAIDALADGLAGVVHAVSPELLVLGGGLAAAEDLLVKPLRSALEARVRVVPVPDVVVGRFGSRAGLVGAGLLACIGQRSES